MAMENHDTICLGSAWLAALHPMRSPTMHKRRMIPLIVLLALVLIPACSSGPGEAEGPGGAVQRFYKHLNDENYRAARGLYTQEALELLSDPEFSTEQSFRNWAKEHTKQGSISGVTILGTETLDTGGTRVEYQIDYDDGAWACVNHFECTRTCPKEIPVTKYINTIKREIKKVMGK